MFFLEASSARSMSPKCCAMRSNQLAAFESAARADAMRQARAHEEAAEQRRREFTASYRQEMDRQRAAMQELDKASASSGEVWDSPRAAVASMALMMAAAFNPQLAPLAGKMIDAMVSKELANKRNAIEAKKAGVALHGNMLE